MARPDGSNWGTLIPRILLGLVFVYHGGQKLFGLFGAPPGALSGLEGAVASWGWPMPAVLARAVGAAEFFGGACLLLGLLTRFWGAVMALLMAVAAWKVHLPAGFSIAHHTEGGLHGWEYNLVLGVLGLSLAVQGGGAFSMDEMFFRGKKKAGGPPG